MKVQTEKVENETSEEPQFEDEETGPNTEEEYIEETEPEPMNVRISQPIWLGVKLGFGMFIVLPAVLIIILFFVGLFLSLFGVSLFKLLNLF